MITLSVNSISKMFGGNTIFENLSLEIHEGDRVGLVGRNGSGKTTLFKLLAGEEIPDSGQIHWRKGTTIGYLKQIPVFQIDITALDVLKTAFAALVEMEKQMKELEVKMASPSLSAEELERSVEKYGQLQDQYTLLGGYEMDANIDRISNGLSIQHLLDKSFQSLSGGEKTKIGLAQLLLQHPDLLLLDEPTNHLDLMSVEWLGQFLKEYKGTVVIVSHDRFFLDDVVTKMLDLEDGEITLYIGNYSVFVKEKEERLLKEFQAYEEQQKKIKKMKEAIKRLREWANRANPPNEGLHKRARNMERALERMEKLDRPILNRKKMNLEMEVADRSGKDVVVMKEVNKSFGEQVLFQDAHLHIQFRERVAMVGENGTGKSTLIKMLLKQEQADSGEVKLGSNVKVGYLSQHIFPDKKDETVIDLFREEIKVTEGEARHILARFLFYGHSVFRKVSQLSGGERMRLRLAQMMYQDLNFLILDEPTNHLDIESREVLEEALEEFNGTILAVSHDRYFLDKLFNRIYWIKDKKLYYFAGGYQWARQKLLEMQPQKIETPGTSKKTRVTDTVKKASTVTIEEIESRIEKVEAHLKELNEKLQLEEELSMIQELYSEKETLEGHVEELYSQLEELA
ncbi:ribosomal protection-like ABC-F family protein [Robertmurraya korlensis]|uniref:ribosomal protection-like ABC-F family protein n=1 Tax=Robertmurraya korlensis TaxID=519977 RepID=UPI002559D6A3|nr:ABC-F type ribosomal protection protein [Robertmurraya korlensis]